MKTKKLKYLATGLMFLLVLGSCSDDLNRFPHASIERSQSFETIEDAATWNTGLYAQFQSRVYGLFMFPTDIQADQLNATLDYGNRNGSLHRWDFLADDYTIRDTWRLMYSSITNINAALEGFETIELEDPDDQAELNKYIAEAHFARAYYYHQLVLRFANEYDPSTAASDLGVPLMLEYDINNFPPRSSVEAVYQQILTDISVAKTGLSSVEGSQGAIYFNSDVVTALEARVKFHMHDFVGAKTAADQLISSGKYPLIDNQEDFAKMWHNDFAQEDILQMFVSVPNEGARTNGIYLGFNSGTGKFSPDFVPSQWVIDMYDDSDIRKDVYFEEKLVEIGGNEYTDVKLVNKYPGNPELFTTDNTNYQHAPKVFRIAEMYLISAEAGGDAGLSALNSLRTARGLDDLDVSGDALTDAVKDERFRELAFEGFRLDDLKRWDEGVERRDPQNLDLIIVGPDFHTLSKEAGNNKFTWGLPTNDITINQDLEQNPGW